jgi:hypothetical protein
MVNVESTNDPLTDESTKVLLNIALAANNGLNEFNFDLNIAQTSSNLGRINLSHNQVEFG